MIARCHPQLNFQLNYTPYDLWHSSVSASKTDYYFHVFKNPTKFNRCLYCVTNCAKCSYSYLSKTIITPLSTGVKENFTYTLCWVLQFGPLRTLFPRCLFWQNQQSLKSHSAQTQNRPRLSLFVGLHVKQIFKMH